MATVKAGNIKRGSYIRFRGKPMLVSKTEFSFPGKGSAFMKVVLKNITSGSTQSFTYKSNESIEELDISSIEMQFLYVDGSEIVFMNPRNYEQLSVAIDLLDGKENMLTAETKVYIQIFEDKPVGVNLPPKVKLKVTDAPEATAGNRSKAAKRNVTLETGLVVQAPLFIKTGDVLVVDTDSGEYVSRGN
ncbi:MAG: elongation factor P [Patescibacteria group bacterium]